MTASTTRAFAPRGVASSVSGPGQDFTLHVVVFDVNVYLDVARLLGRPFSWASLKQQAARLSNSPLPHPDPRCDSLRAIAVCATGKFAGVRNPLQVWTSSDLDATVRLKACQPDDEAMYPEDRGLGWPREHGQGLVDDLVWGIVDRSEGDTVGQVMPYGDPPLDHEDGLIYSACREAADADVLVERYCVTNDRGFIRAELPGYARVMTPARFVQLVRAARTTISVTNMRGPSSPV